MLPFTKKENDTFIYVYIFRYNCFLKIYFTSHFFKNRFLDKYWKEKDIYVLYKYVCKSLLDSFAMLSRYRYSILLNIYYNLIIYISSDTENTFFSIYVV